MKTLRDTTLRDSTLRETGPVDGAWLPICPRRYGVLVVEDDPMARQTLTLQLEADGWTVAAVANLSAARAALAADPEIAVVLCDIHLAGESGIALAGELGALRGEDLATEIVFVTGQSTGEAAIDALRHRAFDFAQKPLSREELTRRIAAAAGSAARRRRQEAIHAEMETRLAEAERLKGRLSEALRAATSRNRDLEKQVGQTRHDLLSVISHELKTPLIPIVGLADILINNADLTTEDVREFAVMIREGGDRLGRIIDRTLDYLDAERQQAEAPCGWIALSDLIGDATPPQEADGRAGRLVVDCPEGLVAWGARAPLAKALAEIVDNAFKAAPAGGAVTIAAGPGGPGQVAIRVLDTGPGIPDTVRRHLGVPFLQGDVGLTRRWSGVGIGLARARRIARLNRGDLVIDPPPRRAGPACGCCCPPPRPDRGPGAQASSSLRSRRARSCRR